ncbi:MAG: EAL domain-containing protein, partial [Burkholderiales bacterium]
GKICLEITESAATTNLGVALENLTRLRMAGFGLSIDDFGTGYSTMQQLTRIPFTELKIDRSFVTNAVTHEAARVLLTSSLQIARQFNLTSVAEGVETQQEWDLLQELGCDLAQGYFIARPMAAGVYMSWLQERATTAAAILPSSILSGNKEAKKMHEKLAAGSPLDKLQPQAETPGLPLSRKRFRTSLKGL